MLVQELKRGLSRKAFIVSFVVGLIFCLVCAFENSGYGTKDEFLNEYINIGVYSSYELFITNFPSRYFNILIIIMPILSSLVYCDTYLEDSKSGFLKSIYVRKNKIRYLLSKFSANFIISGVAFSVPIIINLIIVMIRFPSVETNAVLGSGTVMYTEVGSRLFYQHPIVYILLWLVIFFAYSGLFASIGLSISTFVKNKVVIIFSTFILSIISEIVFEFIDKLKYSPQAFLAKFYGGSLWIIIIEFVILLIVSLLVFVIGGKISELY